LIEVQVLPDPRFVREGDDLSLEWPVSLAEAVLGASIRVPTPTGEVSMTMAPGSISGAKLRLKGNGVPHRSGGRGDQFVRLRIVLPKEPDPELLEFVTNWKAGKAFNPREERVG
jgi:DnaJ-class molecular chaperone